MRKLRIQEDRRVQGARQHWSLQGDNPRGGFKPVRSSGQVRLRNLDFCDPTPAGDINFLPLVLADKMTLSSRGTLGAPSSKEIQKSCKELLSQELWCPFPHMSECYLQFCVTQKAISLSWSWQSNVVSNPGMETVVTTRKGQPRKPVHTQFLSFIRRNKERSLGFTSHVHPGLWVRLVPRGDKPSHNRCRVWILHEPHLQLSCDHDLCCGFL